MRRFKNLHILYPEKFFSEYIPFINENFNPNDHVFLYLKRNGDEPQSPNVRFMRFYRGGLLFYWELFMYASQCNKIILHSLAKPKVVWFLFLFSNMRRKSLWYLWGGDLYFRIEKYSKKIFNPLSYFVFKQVVKNLQGIVSHVNGDVELARSWFGFKGKHIDCFLYPSNLFKPMQLSPKEGSTLNIQIGNSALRSNNHIEAIDKIAHLAQADVRIFCPLAYGGGKNAKLVIGHGKKVFGEKFVPLLDFMPLAVYLEFLSKIDIAIFNHWRQQGLGNIITLLGLGKTVYLRDDVTTWGMLKDKGIHVQNFNSNSAIQTISQKIAQNNIEKVKKSFSMAVLIAQSAKVFSE